MQKFLLIVFALILAFPTFAQISFTNQSDLIENSITYSGAPIAVQDVNGDGLDDIFCLNKTKMVTVYYQRIGQTFEKFEYGDLGGFAWGMATGDVDNDGWSDLFTGGAYDQIKFSKLRPGGEILNTVYQDNKIFVQAVSLADINNDGHLDAFACHDDGPSSIYMNDTNGNLVFDNTSYNINRHFGSTETNAGNYGCVWSDIDSDGDLDLYIVKCRQGVNSPNDPRRINQLWLNDGMGNYTEEANAFGLNIGWQSWTADFQDIDNDGDLDAFVTNHDFRNQLLENIGNNNFEDITIDSGLEIFGPPIQATMKDFDNDGFVDILVSGGDGKIFLNDGDKTFTEIDSIPDLNSFAIGDLNADGFLDIFGGYGSGFNNPSTARPDEVLINSGNDNNYLTVALEGVQSNRDAIGARIEIYGDWGVQIREVRAGESYGITHTAHQNFGLGQSTMIEEIIIRWPSGLVESYEDINANQTIRLIEGVCISPPSNIVADGPISFCSGESVNLCAPAGYTYQWNNGQTSTCINVTDEGNYFVTISDGSDCFSVSTPTIIVVDPEETLSIYTDDEFPFCEGQEITLETDYGSPLTWNNGMTGEQITITSSGTYSASVQGVCEELTSNTLEIEALDAPDAPAVEDVTIDLNTSTTLMAMGNIVEWYDEAIGGNLLALGNSFTTPILEANETYYVEDRSIYEKPAQSVGELEPKGSSDYTGDNFNTLTFLEVYEQSTLISVDVFTDFLGVRKFVLLDTADVVTDSLIIDIQTEGKTVLDLNWNLDPAVGSYKIGTDKAQNNETFGVNSPRLKRISTDFEEFNLHYPYELDGVFAITGNEFGEAFYYYFYNYQIGGLFNTCTSPRAPLTVTVETNSTQRIQDVDYINIYPNPSSGLLNIEIKENRTFDIDIKSLDGKVIRSFAAKSNIFTIDLSDFSAGMYIVELNGKDEVLVGKIIKQ